MNNNTMILQQGYINILIGAIASIVLLILDCEMLGSIAILVTLFLVFVYRNPSRHIYSNSRHILSPIDGKVEAIDITDNETKLYCKVGVCDVHNVKAPISGKMKVSSEQKGLNLDPKSYKGNILNSQVSLEFIDKKENKHLCMKMISGKCNKEISLVEKKKVEQGENISVLTDGIVVISFLNNEKIDVNIGEKLTAGQSVLVTL